MLRGFKETQTKEFQKSLEESETAKNQAFHEFQLAQEEVVDALKAKQEAERILGNMQLHLKSIMEIQAILVPFWEMVNYKGY